MHPRGRGLWVRGGVLAGLLLHGVAGWWTPAGLAQGGEPDITTTNSTSSSTSFESPPVCSPVGSSRVVLTTTVDSTFGPSCIGIGDRDIVDPSPACGGSPAADPPFDPSHGTAFVVVAGSLNINTHTHFETFQCIAAVPGLPWPALLGLGGMLSGLGMWRLRARRATPGSTGVLPNREGRNGACREWCGAPSLPTHVRGADQSCLIAATGLIRPARNAGTSAAQTQAATMQTRLPA